MQLPAPAVKMVPVEADLFESVGYQDLTHCLFLKLRDAQTVRYEKVPRFRFQGLMNAPRKDAYYKTFIKDQFLSRSV
jgi:KTSC domain